MRKPQKKIILDAIRVTGGNVSAAAQKLGCSRRVLYDWMAKDPDIKQAREDAEESLLDMAEGKLYTAVREGDMTAIIFTLKTKGKKRGYVERQEIEIDKNAILKVGYGPDDENGD